MKKTRFVTYHFAHGFGCYSDGWVWAGVWIRSQCVVFVDNLLYFRFFDPLEHGKKKWMASWNYTGFPKSDVSSKANSCLISNINVRKASRRYNLMYIYSALGLLAVRSIYISTLGFLLAMLVRKGFKAWLTYGACVTRAVPCINLSSLKKGNDHKW